MNDSLDDDLLEVAKPPLNARSRLSGSTAHPGSALLVSQVSPLAKQNALILVVGFAVIIGIGTLLFRLPLAGAQRQLTWSEAFFTATSATTVTGLSVITPAVDLSLFGQIVLLLLIEIGGVGFIAFAVLLFSLIGRRVGLSRRLLLQQSLGILETAGIGRLTLYVLSITLLIQGVGALLLWLRWWPSLGAGTAAYQALFHAVSAFCNAGFDLFNGTGSVLFGFGRDPYTLSVLMVLIVIGGIGILVVSDLVTYPTDRRLSVHTKLMLVTSTIVTIIGFVVVFSEDLFATTALSQASLSDHFWVTLFTVVSSRTAGFTILPINDFSQASTLTIMASMFIGGAPASMAGGVTLSTVAVLGVAVLSTVRGAPQAVTFGRVLPFETIAKAVAIMTVSTIVCFVATLALLANRDRSLLLVAFEVISAFSNTGYSLGLTSELTMFGRLVIIVTMFWGRLGPLTLVVLLAQRQRPTFARYPSEPIVIG